MSIWLLSSGTIGEAFSDINLQHFSDLDKAVSPVASIAGSNLPDLTLLLQPGEATHKLSVGEGSDACHWRADLKLEPVILSPEFSGTALERWGKFFHEFFDGERDHSCRKIRTIVFGECTKNRRETLLDKRANKYHLFQHRSREFSSHHGLEWCNGRLSTWM
jgi:hypothetical protein